MWEFTQTSQRIFPRLKTKIEENVKTLHSCCICSFLKRLDLKPRPGINWTNQLRYSLWHSSLRWSATLSLRLSSLYWIKQKWDPDGPEIEMRCRGIFSSILQARDDFNQKSSRPFLLFSDSNFLLTFLSLKKGAKNALLNKKKENSTYHLRQLKHLKLMQHACFL